jgi:hypothetical protein
MYGAELVQLHTSTMPFTLVVARQLLPAGPGRAVARTRRWSTARDAPGMR